MYIYTDIFLFLSIHVHTNMTTCTIQGSVFAEEM